MDKQESILRMYYTVCAVCDTNNEIWQENEVFTSSYRKFQARIPEIQRYRDILKMELIANETIKSIDRIELEEMSYLIASKLLSYAKYMNDENCCNKIQSLKSNLVKSAESELITISSFLSDMASKDVNSLNEFGISIENIAEFQHFITYYSSNLNRIRLSTYKNKTTHDILKKYFKEADEILKSRLDINIEFFKNSDPDFYNQYKAAREVVNFEDDTIQDLTGNVHNFVN